MTTKADTSPQTAGACAGNPNVCLKCSQVGRTCCYCRPGEEEFAPVISESERTQILRFTRCHTPEKDGIVKSANSATFIEKLKQLFPLNLDQLDRLYPPDGWHYRLAIDEQGRCNFLALKGCRLPVDIRPYFCRIYPFWFNGPKLQLFTNGNCEALRTGGNVLKIISSMGTSPMKLRRLYIELSQAWGFYPSKIYPLSYNQRPTHPLPAPDFTELYPQQLLTVLS